MFPVVCRGSWPAICRSRRKRRIGQHTSRSGYRRCVERARRKSRTVPGDGTVEGAGDANEEGERTKTHEHLRVDQSESINDDLSLDGLDRIDDDRDGSRVELFEGLEEGRTEGRTSRGEEERKGRSKVSSVDDLVRVKHQG